jgi:hypothetical protein
MKHIDSRPFFLTHHDLTIWWWKMLLKKSTKTHGLGSAKGLKDGFLLPYQLHGPSATPSCRRGDGQKVNRWTAVNTGWWFWAKPLWKIWVSQLGWWNSQYIYICIYVYMYICINTKCSKPPTRILLKRTTNTPFCKKKIGVDILK